MPFSTWRERAACLGAPVNDFYPDSSWGRTSAISRERADRVIATYCTGCPVKGECLDDVFAVAGNYSYEIVGIRGGILIPGGAPRSAVQQIIDGLAKDPATHDDCKDVAARRAAVERANNRTATGTGHAHGPDLQTAPYRRSARPQLRAVEIRAVSASEASALLISDQRRQHHAVNATARAALADRGVRWSEVRAWALSAGWIPADVKAFNRLAVDAYLAAHREPAVVAS